MRGVSHRAEGGPGPGTSAAPALSLRLKDRKPCAMSVDTKAATTPTRVRYLLASTTVVVFTLCSALRVIWSMSGRMVLLGVNG